MEEKKMSKLNMEEMDQVSGGSDDWPAAALRCFHLHRVRSGWGKYKGKEFIPEYHCMDCGEDFYDVAP